MDKDTSTPEQSSDVQKLHAHIAELEGALERVISEVAAWNRDVAAIIGRIPKSGIDLNAALAVLEAKSEGVGE